MQVTGIRVGCASGAQLSACYLFTCYLSACPPRC